MNRLFARAAVAFSLLVLLPACAAKSIYYYPTRRLYRDPKDFGIPYDLIRFQSLNGKNLYGIYFHSTTPPQGIIVHCHGNYGNVSNHFPLAAFLRDYGFDVFMFDYQGFGGSEGKPSPEKTIEDAQAAIQYAIGVSSGLPVGLFGQSIGAAVASVAGGREPGVEAVALEAGFTTYRGIVKDVMKRSWLLKPFAYFVPWMIVRRQFDPVESVGSIAPRPVFILHGTADRTIPYAMSEELFRRANEPKKFLRIEGADHMQGRAALGKKYEEALSEFFSGAFKATSKSPAEIPAAIPAPGK